MEWLQLPEFFDILEKAKDLGIQLGTKTQIELFYEIACADPEAFPDIYVYPRKYSEDDLQELLRKGEEPLKGTLMPQSMRKQVMNYIGLHPKAFSGYTFGYKDNDVHLTFDKEVTCICGKVFRMEREWEEKIENSDITRHRTDDAQQKKCPECGRQYVKVTADNEQIVAV